MNSIELRHQIHRHPELSNREFKTAERLIQYFENLGATEIITDIGGTGFAVCFGNKDSGKTIMLRSELDALPIHEPNRLDYHSINEGISHKCGHDGHMAILALVGKHLIQNLPNKGRVILLFQPAEETGDGARAVVADPKFAQFKADYIFALHNVPGYPLGQVIIKPETFCCASQGHIIRLKGKPAHAAQPETGISPVAAVATLLNYFEKLPDSFEEKDGVAFATVVGVTVGEEAFGVAASDAAIFVTLRAETDNNMKKMVHLVAEKVDKVARKYLLNHELSIKDEFVATVNHPKAVDIITASLSKESIQYSKDPFRWSEDFGAFTQHNCGAMFALGAGEQTPALHDVDYDFPDPLIEIGARYFLKIVQDCLK